jgi:hypothetical protein
LATSAQEVISLLINNNTTPPQPETTHNLNTCPSNPVPRRAHGRQHEKFKEKNLITTRDHGNETELSRIKKFIGKFTQHLSFQKHGRYTIQGIMFPTL